MNPSEPPRVPLDAAALRRALVDDGPYSALDVTARTASTNDDLAAAGAAHLTVLAAEEQTAGRGRLGRVWAAPPASSLLVSVAVRPPAAAAGRLTWLPLVAGLATQRAARTALAGPPGGTAPGREHDAGPSDGAAVPLGLAWPNDVVADLAARGAAPVPGFGRTRKLAGILCQTVPLPGGGVPAVVIGIGLNVSQTAAELPVPSATSLAQLGVPAPGLDRTALLTALLREVAAAYRAWESDWPGGLPDAIGRALVTLGREVVAEPLPGGERIAGLAVRLDDRGALVLRRADGRELTIEAGDVRTAHAAA